jgi:bisphosphoglycerate-independent phosphoglycerate mutase (AlkP superfamily)
MRSKRTSRKRTPTAASRRSWAASTRWIATNAGSAPNARIARSRSAGRSRAATATRGARGRLRTRRDGRIHPADDRRRTAADRDGDAAIFFNFRPDRARQMTLAFTRPGFKEFPVHAYADFVFATMTKYEEDMTNPCSSVRVRNSDTFGEIVAAAGLTQLRLAETEKYAHVTYFFNGGRETVFDR